MAHLYGETMKKIEPKPKQTEPKDDDNACEWKRRDSEWSQVKRKIKIKREQRYRGNSLRVRER